MLRHLRAEGGGPVSVYFHPGARGGDAAYRQHTANCDQPWHLPYVMGIYDHSGMRLNWYSSVACGFAPCDLSECARDQAPYWPGNEVHLWLDFTSRLFRC